MDLHFNEKLQCLREHFLLKISFFEVYSMIFLVISKETKNSKNQKNFMITITLLIITLKHLANYLLIPRQAIPDLKKIMFLRQFLLLRISLQQILTHEIRHASGSIFPIPPRAGFARRTASLAFLNFPMILNKLFLAVKNSRIL